MEFTREQELAIRLREKDILVSAGAGAGKTRVLVNRLAEMIMDPENPVSVDRFLVMTFTNAAAEEMKERITGELNQRLEKDRANRYLRKQIRMVRHADISTVHSFCNHLIRTHFQEAGIDPSFRIGEEGELFLLRQKAMEDLLEKAYAEKRESFLKLVEAYAPGKDDHAIETLIEELYRFSRGFPNAKQWFSQRQDELKKLEDPETIEETGIMQEMMRKAKRILRECQEQLEEELEVFGDDPEPERFFSLMQEDKSLVEELLGIHAFDPLRKALKKVSFAPVPRATKKEKECPFLEELKTVHKTVREEVEELGASFFFEEKEEICRENRRLRPYREELIRLAEEYEQLYFSYKKEKNVYDFDDLEHIALQILVERYEEGGMPVPSQTADELSRKYQAIFVDEYQDTNMVQETILQTICREGRNHLFVVGDVKQSIYRFRQARPDLFLSRYEANNCAPEAVNIELRDNFRSAPGVLAYCNTVFRLLMDKSFGGVDYTEEIALKPGENGPMAEEQTTSECLLLADDEERQNLEREVSRLEGETAMIARRMKELQEEGYRFKDMVILLRSGAGTAEEMADLLTRSGIPAVCESHTGYFQSREIQLALNYLAIVDNVYQDIPLASVLLSSIGKWTEEEVASLRTLTAISTRKEYALYDLLKLYLVEGQEESVKKKAGSFLRQLEYFRKRKKEVSLHALLWEIYTKTNIYYDVQMMSEGEQRKQNLLMLLKKAEDYEKTVFKGLFYFLRYIEQLRTYEIDLGGHTLKEETADVVRIMTIHKSKGLEFPVVFVSNLSKKFNLMDGNKTVLLHPQMGIGMEYVSLETRIHHPSLQKKVIRERLLQETLEEELRILYVAMTRATKKLILTSVVSSEALHARRRKIPTLEQKMNARCVMDWLVPLLDQLPVQCIHFHELEKLLEKKEEKKEKLSLEEWMEQENIQGDCSLVEKTFSYVYPHREAASWKRKYSVSELKRLSMFAPGENGMENIAGEQSEYLPTVFPAQKEEEEQEIPRPAFLEEKEDNILPAARGTIIHKIMELLPFGEIHHKKDLYDALQKIEKSYSPSAEISMAAVYRGAEAFLFSPVGEKIAEMDRAGKLYKEVPFTVGLPASKVWPTQKQDEMVILQGVVDLCGEEEDGLWLLDYKTDRVQEGQEGLLLDRYQIQMLYYKTALEQVFHKKVKKGYLYSFALQKYLEISWER